MRSLMASSQVESAIRAANAGILLEQNIDYIKESEFYNRQGYDRGQ